MKIKVGNYYLIGSESKNDFKICTISKSKKTGNEIIKPWLFYPKLEQACQRLIELGVHDSEAESLQDILTSIRATRKLIKVGLAEEL